MVKYIVKRLLLAFVNLIGVSIIIYSLVRMMPVDFVTNQFESMVLNGQMTRDEFNRLKEIYGLADTSFGGIMKVQVFGQGKHDHYGEHGDFV